jgi:hypothetical protein
MIVARALKNSQLTCGERHAYFGDRTLGPRPGAAGVGRFPLAPAPIAPFMSPTRANRLLLADHAKKGVKCGGLEPIL